MNSKQNSRGECSKCGGGALLTVDRTSDFPAHVTKTDFLQAAKTAAGLE